MICQQVRRERIFELLIYLIKNNHLYSDINIDKSWGSNCNTQIDFSIQTRSSSLSSSENDGIRFVDDSTVSFITPFNDKKVEFIDDDLVTFITSFKDLKDKEFECFEFLSRSC